MRCSFPAHPSPKAKDSFHASIASKPPSITSIEGGFLFQCLSALAGTSGCPKGTPIPLKSRRSDLAQFLPKNLRKAY
ncbi:hypothetical protein CN238_07655 [Sinorhizobium meliloti]|nr:hypothetical protein CN238_07655 [Sinorhizobium meliloti]RVH25081.1 hypothetical protein CN211_30595 [Sinorhizobium meliloti]RVH33330.1 hypothetical protein CN214_09410 [Sinorhizobium meliloti]